MPTMLRSFRLLSVIALSGVLGACASAWERSYAPAAPDGTPLAPQQSVKVRDVPWERLDAALRELDAERAASDAPPDEWPADKKAGAKQRLLTALQVTADPATAEILGRSTFRTTSQTNPNDGELASFARKIGANTVVWSSNYLGKTQVVRDEPVSEWRSGSWAAGRDGRRRYDSFTEHSTIWVPVVVEADEHAFVAYFIRTP